MGFVQGEGRTQGTLFPVCLEELIPGDHVCRVIDAFVRHVIASDSFFFRFPLRVEELVSVRSYSFLIDRAIGASTARALPAGRPRIILGGGIFNRRTGEISIGVDKLICRHCAASASRHVIAKTPFRCKIAPPD